MSVATRSQKKLHGQFYTKANPFHNDLFLKWLETVPKSVRKSIWLEPFAGANHIVKLVDEVKPTAKPSWECYDIQPGAENVAPRFQVIQRDTLASFPPGFELAITNPPYLA